MIAVDGRAFRIAWTVLVAASLAWLLYQLRGVLFLFALAVLFAYVIWPLVAFLERVWLRVTVSRRTARLLALAVVYPVLIGLAVLAATVAAPRIARQGTMLVGEATGVVGQIQRGELLENMSRRHEWWLPVIQIIRSQVLSHAGEILARLQQGFGQLVRFLSNLWVVVLIPILAFFLLRDAERLEGAIENWLISAESRDWLRRVVADLHELLARYMRGLILLSLLSFAAQALFFLIAGVPYALMLATLAGILEFIPMVGPLAAAVIVVVASLLAGYPHLLWIVVFLGAWRLVQDYVNMPWVLGAGIELHPLLVILGVLAGAEVAGVAGMFLSIPILAAGRILLLRSAARDKALR